MTAKASRKGQSPAIWVSGVGPAGATGRHPVRELIRVDHRGRIGHPAASPPSAAEIPAKRTGQPPRALPSSPHERPRPAGLPRQADANWRRSTWAECAAGRMGQKPHHVHVMDCSSPRTRWWKNQQCTAARPTANSPGGYGPGECGPYVSAAGVCYTSRDPPGWPRMEFLRGTGDFPGLCPSSLTWAMLGRAFSPITQFGAAADCLRPLSLTWAMSGLDLRPTL